MKELRDRSNLRIAYHKKNRYYNQEYFVDDKDKYTYIGMFISPFWENKMNKSFIVKQVASVTGHGIKELYNILFESSHDNPIEIQWEQIVPLQDKSKGAVEFVANSKVDGEIDQEKKEWEETVEKLKEAEEWVKTLGPKEQDYVEAIRRSMIAFS